MFGNAKPFYHNEVPLTASEERAIAHQSFKLSYIIRTWRNVLIFKQFYFVEQHLFLVCLLRESVSSSVITVFICWLLDVSFSTDWIDVQSNTTPEVKGA